MSDPNRAELERSELGRPSPHSRWPERVRQTAGRYRAGLQTRRELGRDQMTFDADADVVTVAPTRTASSWFTAFIAAGAIVLVLGCLWAWQSWSQRSAQPIDDLLPVLAGDALEPVGDAPPAEKAPTQNPNPATVDAPPAATATTVIESIVVHVSGAVRRPGVVELMAGARVVDAVELVGGELASADLDRVNLAAPLVDGERIHIPAHGEIQLPVPIEPDRPAGHTGAATDDGLPADPLPTINITTATVDDFESLPGIGPAIASAIVQTRAERGPFLSIDELLDVPGIGESKLALIRHRLTLSG